MSRWFRHYAGMMRDDKLVRVAIRSKQTIERVVWIWGAILESAAEIDEDGRYDLDAPEIAYFLRADQSDVDVILSALSDAGRVADSRVVKWGGRQFQSDRSNVRVAAHRERKRSERGGGNGKKAACNADVTLQARDRNAPETELETETEVSVAKATSSRAWALPAGVSLQVWTDLKKNRARKRLPNTDTAWKGFLDDLISVSAETGIPPPELIQRCVAKGWGAIYDPRTENDRQQRPNSLGRHQSPDGLSSTARAAIAVFGR